MDAIARSRRKFVLPRSMPSAAFRRRGPIHRADVGPWVGAFGLRNVFCEFFAWVSDLMGGTGFLRGFELVRSTSRVCRPEGRLTRIPHKVERAGEEAAVVHVIADVDDADIGQ